MDIRHGTKLVRVTLTEEEWVGAFRDAYRRDIETRSGDRRGRAMTLGLGTLAVGAEFAVAGVTGRKWTGHLGHGSEDVRGLQVKFTNTRNLIIRERNPDGRYVVVTGGLKELVVRGYYDVVKSEEVPVRPVWADEDARDVFVYLIPFSSLSPIKELSA